MIKFLINAFIKDKDDIKNKEVRANYGTLSGVLGIILNFILFLMKFASGIVINSIAVISDSFNNLSDMGSSLVSAIGMKMSTRKPDKEHPFGHGRIEYISALIVSFIILLMGKELFQTSLGKIIRPEKVQVSILPVVVLFFSMAVKLWMYKYNKYIGNLINSKVIKATAQDCLNDFFATLIVIVATVAGSFINLPLDGIFGCIVSVMIFYAGFSFAKETIGTLLGTVPDPEVVKSISKIILEQDNICGIHDLIVHDYGPGRSMASVHAEVPNDVDIVEIHEIIDATEKYIAEETGVHIVIHMDPLSVNCERTNSVKEVVKDVVKNLNPDFDIHDFRMTDGENNINLIFDLEVPCEMSQEERKECVLKIREELKKIDKKYSAVIMIDNKY